MGKKKKIEKNNDKTVKSINNGVRSSVRKREKKGNKVKSVEG
jgi:hypothetical protein